MNIRYTAGALISIPLLPLMYLQGRKVRASVPRLSEAAGPEGECKCDKDSNRIIRLLTLGESTIAGVGVNTHEEGFTGTLANELSRLFKANVNWKVYARSGYTARKVLDKVIPNILEKEADLIVIGLGANDAFTLNRPHRWKVEVRQLIEALKQKFPSALIVFCNMPPIKEFPAFTPLIKFVVGNLVELLGEELDDLTAGYGNVYYCNEVVKLDNWIRRFDLKMEKAAFFSDGVHPSLLTYQIWAKDVAQQIRMEEITIPL